jgi:YegS/Rv2252/BmrU family lipid kinase
MQSFNNNRTIVIINPKAGPKRLDFVTSNLKRYRNELDYTTISDIGEFRRFIKDNFDKYDLFIVAGGDGTVNSLASELSGTSKLIGVLPAGSGNGFAREMGFKKNLRWLLKNIRKNESFSSDVLYINDRICVNVAGVGIDSFVAHGFNHLPRRGLWNYMIMALRTAAMIRPFTVHIRHDNTATDENVYMVSVANTRQFGNNALIAPGAIPNDGKFNVAVVKPFRWYLFPYFAFKMLSGSLEESKYLNYIVTDEPVEMTTMENRYHIDGEPVFLNGKITVTIRKNALQVLKTDMNRWI